MSATGTFFTLTVRRADGDKTEADAAVFIDVVAACSCSDCD